MFFYGDGREFSFSQSVFYRILEELRILLMQHIQEVPAGKVTEIPADVLLQHVSFFFCACSVVYRIEAVD